MGLLDLQNEPGQQQAEGEAEAGRYTDETDNNVSPEEQAQYSRFEENAAKLIYDSSGGQGSIRPEILESLQSPAAHGQQQQGASSKPHVTALANTAVVIVSKLDDSARDAGQPLSDDVLLAGGQTVIEMLVEAAEESGQIEYSEDDMTGAFTLAADMYRDKAIADGRTDADTLKGQWDELISAEQSGEGSRVLPGLDRQPAQ